MQQQGRKGRGSDRAVRLHRSDYRATIIANPFERKKKKKEGNIRQLREFEFRLLAKVKKLASNTDIGSFHHPRGIDRGS